MPTPDSPFDIAIVGAGIAGAAVAYFAAPHARVLLLERESQPGHHSTGRSAALFMESYGGTQVRAFTRASRPFLQAPPDGFAGAPLLAPRGALFIGRADQADAVRALHATLNAEGCPAELWTTEQAIAQVPVLRPEAVALAVLDTLAADLDVNELHQGFLRGARARGAQLLTDAELTTAHRDADGCWALETRQGRLVARRLVNAAGAWVDEVARRCGVAPVGIEPRRRSAFTFPAPAGVDIHRWPCVAGIDDSFYFKPDAGLLLGSPANADPVAAHDVLPEEMDIAIGIARIEEATTLQIRRPRHAWAGLRSFVGDDNLLAGFDPSAPGFFWVAGQGGYGIQTAPAMGAWCAAQLLGQPRPDWMAEADAMAPTLAVRRPG